MPVAQPLKRLHRLLPGTSTAAIRRAGRGDYCSRSRIDNMITASNTNKAKSTIATLVTCQALPSSIAETTANPAD